MKNKKGFTLIELLAVIVILAVIALIATPIILNMIESAKKSAAKDSAYGYIKAIEYETSLADLKGKKYEDKEDYTYNEIKVNIKGEAPTGGRYSLKNGVVTSGVFCINGYTVNYSDNTMTVGDKGCIGEDLKYEGKVVLSETQGDYTYPESRTFEVKENLSGGTLSCTTSDSEVATCSIEGNVVTVKPGTKEDSATLTIISASTEKYKEAQAAYLVKTIKGTIPSVTSSGYTGIYDGQEHGIIVSTTLSGATIKYGTEEGKYTLTENPTYIDAGTYTIYYQVSKDGYKPVTGSNQIIIEEATIFNVAKTLVYDDNGICSEEIYWNRLTYEYMGGCYMTGTSSSNKATTKNYVWYNGFMWRIMGINSDGTVRLITDENVAAIPYGSGYNSDALTYATNEDYIHDWLNEYFLGHLNSTKSIIKEGNYFCSELKENDLINTDTTEKEERKKCLNGKVKARVGLLSYDEYYLATESSYLLIFQGSWTMTPRNNTSVWYTRDWYYGSSNVGNAYGVRPVINVEPNSIITKGTGTASDYYVLVEDKTSDKTGTISSIVTSGEYVSLEGKTYRVVSKESDGVKLILDGYVGTLAFGSDNKFTTTSGIGLKLNDKTDSTSVINTLGLKDSTKIVESTWYQGDGIQNGFKYTDVLNSTNNGVKAKVGLIRVGEMLSGQSSTLLTKKYTSNSLHENVQSYMTMNNFKYAGLTDEHIWNTTDVWYVFNEGYASSYYANEEVSSIRPVIVVRNDLNISGGTGTWDNPYEI